MPNVDGQPTEVNHELATQLVAGVYTVERRAGATGLQSVEPRGKPAVRIPSRPQRQLEQEVANFFDSERTRRLQAAGLLHRGGVLIHGRPGRGKSSMVATVYTQCVDAGAVVLLNPEPETLLVLVPKLREAITDLPLVVVYDAMWPLREVMDEPLRRTIRRTLNPLLAFDRLLLILVIDLGAVPDALAEPDLVQRVIEIGDWSQEARRRLIAEHYPQLSDDERHFALELTAGAAQLLLHEACRLLLAGDEPDVVRDRIEDLRNVRAVTSHDLLRRDGSDDPDGIS
jgi:hypothetical protein